MKSLALPAGVPGGLGQEGRKAAALASSWEQTLETRVGEIPFITLSTLSHAFAWGESDNSRDPALKNTKRQNKQSPCTYHQEAWQHLGFERILKYFHIVYQTYATYSEPSSFCLLSLQDMLLPKIAVWCSWVL